MAFLLLFIVYCFWASEEIILFFFGDQWLTSIPVFKLLSLSGWPQLGSTSAGAIYQSTGNTKLMFKSGTIHFSTTIALIVLGVLLGELEIVALLVTISLFLRFFIDYYFLVVKGFACSFGDFLMEFRADIPIMGAMICTIAVGQCITIHGILLSLLIKALILGTVYLGAVLFTGQLRYLRDLRKR